MVEDKQFVRFGLIELQQRNAHGQVVQEYAWDKLAAGGIGGLLVTKAKNEVFTYVYNHLGHVQKVLDSSGQEIESYRYSPYGQVEGGNFSQQPFGYSTKRSDFKSGLVYFGYRFYSPYQRRWLNRDPLQEQGGINLYAYVNGDPLGYMDPDGRHPILIAMLIGGVNGGVGAWVQGGNFDAILEGAASGLWGGLLGLGNPILGAMAGNAAGQLMAMDRNNRPISCFNWGAMLGSGLGSGLAAGLASYPGATLLGAQLDFGFSTIGGIVGGL